MDGRASRNWAMNKRNKGKAKNSRDFLLNRGTQSRIRYRRCLSTAHKFFACGEIPRTIKAAWKLLKGSSWALDSVIARSNCSRAILPAGIPLRREICFSQSIILSVLGIVNVRRIGQYSNAEEMLLP